MKLGVLDYYPAFALVAIIGGFWGHARMQSRRLQKAVTEVAAKLKGRYEPGGHLSGGNLFVKVGDRDVVFVFNLSHSARSESTSVAATLAKPLVKPLHLRGREAIARAPWLRGYSSFFFPARIEAGSNQVQVDLVGVVRNADRLIALATAVAALAAELESP